MRPENGERLLQLTKETWSLEEKKKRNNKAVTVPKKEQTTKQFLLVHTCSQKVQGIFAAYQQDNFTTTDDFKCTGCKHCQKEAVKPRGQYHGRFCNQPFFFSWRWEMQNLGLRSTYFHNRRPHWATDFKQLQAKRRAEVLIRTIWRMWVTVRNLGDQGDKSAWSDSYTG